MSGRAWQRTGISDAPASRSETDAQYGVLPDQIDHPEVWNDWSGGYGHQHRKRGANTYHWAENFDARTPNQLVHCQAPQMVWSVLGMDANNQRFTEMTDEIIDSTLVFSANAEGASTIGLFNRNCWMFLEPTATSFVNRYSGTLTNGSPQFLHRAAVYGSYMYVGNSAGTGFLRIDAAAQFTWMPSPGYRFAVAGDRLWRAHGASRERSFYLQHVADPSGVWTMANWAATYNIGNQAAPIKDIIGFGEQIYAGTSDGLYVGDSTGTFVNVLAELANQPHPDNCRDLAIFDNSVVATHIGGIFAYQTEGYSGRVNDITPPRDHLSPLQGRFRCVRGYGRYLYAGLYTGSQSWLLSGERGENGIVWHPLNRLPHQTKINRIHVDGVMAGSGGYPLPNRIWIATDASIDTSGTAPTYAWPIPMLDGNPLAPSPAFSANYVGSARMDLGIVDWESPTSQKVYRAFEVWADNISYPTRYCDVYYDVDRSGSWTLLGSAKTSPKSVLYFSGAEGSFVSGQSIEISIRSFCAPDITPIYRAFAVRGTLRPKSVDQIIAMVRIADKVRDRQGKEMRSGATMLSQLREFALSKTPTKLVDLAGATNYVSVIPPVEEREIYQQGEENPEIVATLKMAVMEFSPPVSLTGVQLLG